MFLNMWTCTKYTNVHQQAANVDLDILLANKRNISFKIDDSWLTILFTMQFKLSIHDIDNRIKKCKVGLNVWLSTIRCQKIVQSWCSW